MARDTKQALMAFRSKYPGAYDKYTDDELLSALQKKYPGAYNDLTIQKTIPKTESVFDRALSVGRKAMGPQLQAGGGLLNTAMFGVPGAVTENFAPQGFKDFIEPQGTAEQIGRGVGDIAGFSVGGPAKLAKGALRLAPKANRFVKGAIGASAATASLSPSELASGSTPQKEAMKVGGTGLLGGALEKAPNVLMKGLFRKNIKREKLDSLTKDLQDLKNRAEAGDIEYDESQLLDEAKSIYERMAGPVKKKAGELKAWIDELEKRATSKILDPTGKPYKVAPKMRADEVRQMEQELGSATKFTSEKSGFFSFLNKPKSPSANKAYQRGRTAASESYDVKAGPEHEVKSKKISKILKRYPDLDPSKDRGDYGARVGMALLAKGLSQNPAAPLVGYMLEKALEAGESKQAIYKFLTNPGTKKALSGAKKSFLGAFSTQT